MKTEKNGGKIDIEKLRAKYLPLKDSDFRVLTPAAQEACIFKYLRALVASCAVTLRGDEHSQWVSAKATGCARDFADDLGLTLSSDIPKHIRGQLSSGVDYLEFEDAWRRAVGPNQLVEPGDKWMESLIRYVNSVSIWQRDES